MSYGEGREQGVTDRELDLLVDGQLDDASQRDILARLERQPEAWRRCALTFLEAQCLSKEFGSLTLHWASRPAGVATHDLPQSLPSPAPRRSWNDRVPSVLLMAGSFLFALGLGLVGRSWLAAPEERRGPERTAPPAALASTPADLRQPAMVFVPTRPRSGDPPAPPSGWRMVTLAAPEGSAARKPIQVPAVESDQLDEGWLHNMPSEVPIELLRALERTGHAVQQSRRLVPMPLEDGRRVVVPVDQFEVHYVGNKAYQ